MRYYDSPFEFGITYYGESSSQPFKVWAKYTRPSCKEDGDKVRSYLLLFAKSRLLSRKGTSISDISDSSTNLSSTNNGLNIVQCPPVLQSVSTFDGFGQPYISFKSEREQLSESETDLVLITGRCFAAGAFTDPPFGGWKCKFFFLCQGAN